MTPIEIGLISVVAIVFLIYSGVYIPIALGMVSFVSIWLMRDNFQLAMNLLKIAVGDSVMEYAFATDAAMRELNRGSFRVKQWSRFSGFIASSLVAPRVASVWGSGP